MVTGQNLSQCPSTIKSHMCKSECVTDKRYALISQKTRHKSTVKQILLMTFRKNVAIEPGGRYHYNCPFKGSLMALLCIDNSRRGNTARSSLNIRHSG